jgi:cytochrome c oxidase subunit 3
MKKILKNNQKHSFHLVDSSPWPFFGACSGFMLTFGGVFYMHGLNNGFFLLKVGFFMLLLTMFGWWRDVIREGTFEGQHTQRVQKGLKIGMILFIISEVMFFFGIFWAFFHSSLNPSIFIGGVWPPAFLTTLDPWKIPLLNTILLVSSGATVTWAHHAVLIRCKRKSLFALFFTLVLAVLFLFIQAIEFKEAPFSFSDGVYASTFFMATGFHGFHVLIGFIFLSVCYFRIYFNHFSNKHHVGFEAAAWYWHFVDVVWLFLFITVYWWGS